MYHLMTLTTEDQTSRCCMKVVYLVGNTHVSSNNLDNSGSDTRVLHKGSGNTDVLANYLDN